MMAAQQRLRGGGAAMAMAYDLDDNTTRMDGLAKRKGRGRHTGRGNEDGG